MNRHFFIVLALASTLPATVATAKSASLPAMSDDPIAANAVALQILQKRWARPLAQAGVKPASVSETGLLRDGIDGQTVQTGVTAPGDFHRLADDSFLVAGRGAVNGGRVEHWTRDVFGSFVLSSVYSQLGTDFAGVMHDANSGQLYVLETQQKRIWRAAWNGSSALPSGWTTWATQADVAELGDAPDQFLDLVWPAPADPATDPGHVYLGRFPELYLLGGTAITGSPGSITSGDWNWYDPVLIPEFLIDQTSASELSTNLTVGTPGPVPSGPINLEVVHLETDTVLGSGVLLQDDEELTLTLSQALVLGDHYVARTVGQSTPEDWAFSAMRRYGAPESLADGTALRRIYKPIDTYIGNPALGVLLGVEAGPSVPNPPSLLSGFLLVGLRGAGGDPVIPFGSNYLLSPAVLTLPASGFLGDDGFGLVSGQITIPNDPNLIGAVVFVQFALTDPAGGNVLSEVVGFELTAP